MMKVFELFWIFVFFAGMVVPLFHMNTAEITEQENRTLVKFPETKKKGKININYGKEFEAWLGDRFWGRNALIKTKTQMLYKINGRIENEEVFVGDDGWMFEKSKVINVPSIEKQREKIKKDAEILRKLADKFKKKNIVIYLVLMPEREEIYQKYWERYYRSKPKLNYENEMKKLISDYPTINLIPIRDKLQEMTEKELVFYKDDYHLTKSSIAFVVQQVFFHIKNDNLQKLKGVVLNRKEEIKRKKHRAGLSARLMMAGLTEEILPVVSLRFLDLESKTLEAKSFVAQENNDHKKETIYPYVKSVNNNAPIKKSGIFLGPCYTEYAYNILKPLFKTSIKIRSNVSLLGKDALFLVTNKINELSNLEDGSAVFVMIVEPWNFYQIAQLMDLL